MSHEKASDYLPLCAETPSMPDTMIDVAPPPAPHRTATHKQRSGVLHLLNATVGIGLLAVPHTFATCGLVGGLAVHVAVVAATLRGTRTLLHTADRLQAHSLEEVARKSLVAPGEAVVRACVVLAGVGTCVAETVALADVATAWLPQSRAAVLVGLSCLVLGPLSVASHGLSDLTCVSTLACVAYVTLTCGVALMAVADPVPQASWSPLPSVSALVSGASLSLFAYLCTPLVFHVRAELHAPEDAWTVCVAAAGLAAAVYVVVGVGACVRFGAVHGNVMEDLLAADTRETTSLVLFVALSVCLSYPLPLFAAHRALRAPNTQGATVAIVVLVTALALLAERLDRVLTWMGALPATVLVYVLPSALAVRTDPQASRCGAGAYALGGVALAAYSLLAA